MNIEKTHWQQKAVNYQTLARSLSPLKKRQKSSSPTALTERVQLMDPSPSGPWKD